MITKGKRKKAHTTHSCPHFLRLCKYSTEESRTSCLVHKHTIEVRRQVLCPRKCAYIHTFFGNFLMKNVFTTVVVYYTFLLLCTRAIATCILVWYIIGKTLSLSENVRTLPLTKRESIVQSSIQFPTCS